MDDAVKKALIRKCKTCKHLMGIHATTAGCIGDGGDCDCQEGQIPFLAKALEQAEAERDALIEEVKAAIMDNRPPNYSVIASLKERIEHDCDHDFVDATNEVVQGGEVCIICGGVRASLGED